MTPTLIAKLEELLKKATPWPWDNSEHINPRNILDGGDSIIAVCQYLDGTDEEVNANAALITLLRNSIQDLLDERKRHIEALEGIQLYSNDTLSGRVDGPEDRAWFREGIIEVRNRAKKALAGDGGGA